MTKTIRYIPKGIKPNSVPVQEIKITAKTEEELDKLTRKHAVKHILLNYANPPTKQPQKLRGRGSFRGQGFYAKNMTINT